MLSRSAEILAQRGARVPPLTLDGSDRNAQYRADLFDGEPQVKLQLDHADHLLTDLVEYR